MAQYYNHFIPDFHMMKKPLAVLLQRTTQWHWDLAHQHAFENIKAALASSPVLMAPGWNRTFIVHTDWSNTGSGYVLAQEDDEHREYVIAYGSYVNSSTETNYFSYEGELMVVKKTVIAWRYYLQGRHLIIVTDHKPLFWLMTTPHLRGKFAKLAIQLSEIDFEIKHRAGTKHIDVDGLSRLTKRAVGWERPLESELLAATAYQEMDIWTQRESLFKIQDADVEDDSPLRQYEWKEGVLWKTFPNGIKVQVPPPT